MCIWHGVRTACVRPLCAPGGSCPVPPGWGSCPVPPGCVQTGLVRMMSSTEAPHKATCQHGRGGVVPEGEEEAPPRRFSAS